MEESRVEDQELFENTEGERLHREMVGKRGWGRMLGGDFKFSLKSVFMRKVPMGNS